MAEQNKTLQTQLNALKFSDWIKIVLVLLAAAFLVYRCFLPWRAEYAYREAFNADAQGNKTFAIEKYQKAIRLAPWETYYHVQLGRIYEEMAQKAETKPEKLEYIKKAEDIYKQCLAISPTNPWYINRMGEVYGLYAGVADNPKDAEKFMKMREDKIIEAASMDPNNALFQLSVAYLYHQKRDFDTALKKYAHVLEIDDTMGEAYFNMADIYRQRGQRQNQMEMYKKIVEKRPDFKNAHLQLGKMYEDMGQLDNAIREYIEEVKLDKNNKVAFQVLGVALFRKSDWGNMEKVYHRLTMLEPENINFYIYEAQAQLKQGRLDDAIATLENANSLNPNDNSIKNFLNQLRMAKNPARKATAAPAPAAQEQVATASVQ